MHKEEKSDNTKNIVFCCLCLVIALVAIAALIVIKNSSGDSFTPSGTVGAVDNLSIFPTKDSMTQEFFDADTFIGETDDEELDINENGEAEDFSNLESSDGGESAENINTDPNTRIAGSSLTFSNGCWHKKGSSKCYTGWATNFNAKGCTAYLKKGVKKQGWLKYDGNFYYLSKDPGWTGCKIANAQTEINKKTYRFDQDGKMVTGWFEREGIKDECRGWVGEHCTIYHYYGYDGVMRTGWQWIGNVKQYFDKQGRLLDGLQTINGKIYYFDNGNYKMGRQTGWQKICYYPDIFSYCESGTFYFGNDGVMRTGWQTIDGKKYYFTKDASAFTSGGAGDLGVLFGKKGVMKTGWQWIGSKKYYFGPKSNQVTTGGYMRTGIRVISNKKYYFGIDGAMQYGMKVVNGKRYLFGKDGAAKSGWQTVSGKKYYFGSDYVAYSGGWRWVVTKTSRSYCRFNNDATLDRCKKK